MSEKPIGVLFVCTGNICRSPTAEGVFRNLVREAGTEELFTIQSAGTHGYHVGEPPDPRSVATALAHGVDMRAQRARKFEQADFDRFDYIFAMDRGHLNHLNRLRQNKGAGRYLGLYMGYPEALQGQDVPDPYYSDNTMFEQVYEMIESQARNILNSMSDEKLARLK